MHQVVVFTAGETDENKLGRGGGYSDDKAEVYMDSKAKVHSNYIYACVYSYHMITYTQRSPDM